MTCFEDFGGVTYLSKESYPAATMMFSSSRQGNPLGEEHADSARPLGFSSDVVQGKDRL
jgi:hypothetical protein